MTVNTDHLQHMLFDTLSAERPAVIAAVPPHRRVLTPAEVKAGETTRVAREFTDAEAVARHAQVARLKQARLERQAEEKAAKAAEPPAKKGRKRA